MSVLENTRLVMKITTFYLALILIISSCSSGPSNEEYNRIVQENIRLKNELEQCQSDPEKLLGQAQVAYKANDFEQSKEHIDQIIINHPSSEQAEKGKLLLTTIEEEVKQKEEEERLAAEKKVKAEAERLANATKKMRTSYDDINNITWYYDRSSPRYNNVKNVQLYMGKKEDSEPWLRLKISYTADDWLFVEKYTFNIDGKNYHITEDSYGEIKQDNSAGNIWEWLDRGVDTDEMAIVKAMVKAEQVKLRYVGKDYYDDRTISNQEIQAVKNVLDAYEALGGVL